MSYQYNPAPNPNHLDRLIRGFNGCSDEFPFFETEEEVHEAAKTLGVNLSKVRPEGWEQQRTGEAYVSLKLDFYKGRGLDKKFPNFPLIVRGNSPSGVCRLEEIDYQLKALFEQEEELSTLQWLKLEILIHQLKEEEKSDA